MKRFSSTAAATTTSHEETSSGEENNEDEEFSDSEENKKPKKTPKEHLLESLKKLADTFSKYSLTDREMFLSDLESILKILTY